MCACTYVCVLHVCAYDCICSCVCMYCACVCMCTCTCVCMDICVHTLIYVCTICTVHILYVSVQTDHTCTVSLQYSMTNLYKKLFPVVLQLACDVERVSYRYMVVFNWLCVILQYTVLHNR